MNHECSPHNGVSWFQRNKQNQKALHPKLGPNWSSYNIRKSMSRNILRLFKNRQNPEVNSHGSQQRGHPDLCWLVHDVDVRAGEAGWGSVYMCPGTACACHFAQCSVLGIRFNSTRDHISLRIWVLLDTWSEANSAQELPGRPNLKVINVCTLG